MLIQKDFQRYGSTLDPFDSIDDVKAFLATERPDRLEIVGTVHEAVVGFAGLYMLPGRQTHVGSFTLSVHEDHQKIGIGTVLMKAILGIGFHLLALQRIQATVFTDNTRALSLYRRLGFVIEGTLSKFARREDGFVDAHLIALMQLPTPH